MSNPDRQIPRRLSTLAFRPQTSYSPSIASPASASSSSAASTPRWLEPANPSSDQTSHETLRRIARELYMPAQSASRWSGALSPADNADGGQVIASPTGTDASDQRQRRGSHNLLSLGKSIVRRASTTLTGPGKAQKSNHGGSSSSSSTFDREISPPSLISTSLTIEPRDQHRPSTALPVRSSFSQLRPTTSASSAAGPSGSRGKKLFRRMKSTVKHRRDAISQPSGQRALPDSSFQLPLETAQSARLHQFDWPRQRPGAAARASAREAQSAQSQLQPQSQSQSQLLLPPATASSSSVAALSRAANGMRLGEAPGRPAEALSRKDTKCSQPTRDSMLTEPDASDGERDSIIFGMSDAMGPDLELKKDPIEQLPPELCAHIFSYLDYESLEHAAKVSRAWRDQASRNNRALWRQVFLNRFEPRNRLTPLPLQMGGPGIGKKNRATRDWHRMYKTRLAIERNWREGTPNAIYFQGHTDSVYCAQFDEHKIITGSRDRTIRIWDINTYKCLKVIGGPSAKPEAASLGDIPRVELDTHAFTIEKGRNLNGTPEGDELFYVPDDFHTQSVLCLQFDDDIMVTGSSDATCIVWDMKGVDKPADPDREKPYEIRPIRRLRHHAAGVLDVCFDGRFIVSCSKDNNICVWSRRTGDLVTVLSGHCGPVNAVQMRGHFLVSASGDGISKLWDLNKMKCVRDFHSKDRGLAAVEFSDDGRYVLAGGNDMIIYKYCVATGELLRMYKGHQGLVRSLFLDTQNNRVVSGSYDQAMRVFDFETGESVGGDAGAPNGALLNAARRNSTVLNGHGGSGAYENWTTSWILSAKSDYRRIVATSQDGRALLMDFGRDVDPGGLELLRSGEGA